MLWPTHACPFQLHDEYGQTALNGALRWGGRDSVLRLLEQGANPSIPDTEGLTPLFVAIRKKDIELLDALLERGASLSEKDVNESTALQLLSSGGDIRATRIALKHGVYGRQALNLVVGVGDIASVLALIQSGADLNVTDGLGRSPLMTAVIHRRQRVARMLVDPGADVAHRDSVGQSSLVYAVRAANVDGLHFLVDRGLDVNETVEEGRTLLMVAVQRRRPDVVRALLDRGADVFLLDDKGQSVLAYTVGSTRGLRACREMSYEAMTERTLR